MVFGTKAINAAIFLVCSIFFEDAWAQSDKDDIMGYLLISTPQNAKISYVKLPEDGNFVGLTPKDLITTGLKHPQGLAIDHKRKRLFVSDPDEQRVYAYQLAISGNDLTCDGRQTIISSGVESRWVSVDGLGNVFFSDEPNSRIYKITMTKMLRGNTTAELLYDGQSVTQVNRPGGVAVDNFHVFWTNKHFGTKSGTVVKGAEVLPPGGTMQNSLSVLASNVPKSYGVCLALNNVFFTDSSQKLFGVKKNGGAVYEISTALHSPRGCVWDGDGSVFVADRGNNAVYSFAGNMGLLTRADVIKAFDFDDAFGLAFMSPATRALSSFAIALALAVSSALFPF